MKVTVLAQAQEELTRGALFYSREAGAALGHAFVTEFERSVVLLGEHAQLGARWRGNTRRLPMRRFPYSIIYLVMDSEVRVVALAHQRRKPGFWSGRS